MWWADVGEAEAARPVEAASKVWGDNSLIILSYSKH
jgi:hypothetical protein